MKYKLIILLLAAGSSWLGTGCENATGPQKKTIEIPFNGSDAADYDSARISVASADNPSEIIRTFVIPLPDGLENGVFTTEWEETINGKWVATVTLHHKEGHTSTYDVHLLPDGTPEIITSSVLNFTRFLEDTLAYLGDTLEWKVTLEGDYRFITWTLNGDTLARSGETWILNGITASDTGEYLVAAGNNSDTITTSARLSVHPANLPVTVDAPHGRTEFSSDTVWVARGARLQFSIEPDEGYLLDSVWVDGDYREAASETGFVNLVDITEAVAVRASFSLKNYRVVIAVDFEDGSRHSRDSVSLPHGSDTVFSLPPPAGFRIKEVSVNDVADSASSVDEELTVKALDTSLVIRVILEETILPVELDVNEGGFVSLSDTANLTVGDSLRIGVQPYQGYRLDSILVNGVFDSAATAGGQLFIEHLESKPRITIRFSRITYIVRSTAVGRGTVSPDSLVASFGSDTSVAILPDSGYGLDSVYLNGVFQLQATRDGRLTLEGITRDHHIRAVFVRQFRITTHLEGGGQVFPSSDLAVDSGGNASLQLSADSGFALDSVWLDDTYNPDAVNSGSLSLESVMQDHRVRASFLPTFTITSSSSNGGELSPGGTATVKQGDSLVLRAEPETGYSLDSLFLDGRFDSGATGSGSLTLRDIRETHQVRAVFGLRQYTLTSGSNPGGSINPADTLSREHGSSQTYTFATNTGFVLDSVIVNGENHPQAVAEGSYTVDPITEDVNIRLVFKRLQLTLSAIAGTGGSISPSGILTVAYGESVLFDITPDAGYSVDSILVAGQLVMRGPKVTQYTLPNITSNTTVRATFFHNRTQDSLALIALYNGLDGENWTRSTNWLSAQPINTWHGVTVVQERVTIISLEENNLSGDLPAAVRYLTGLQQLQAYNNAITSLPPEIGNLASLGSMDLENNNLQSLPAAIGNLQNLTSLWVNRNNLTELPTTIGDLTQLVELFVSGNSLTSLPSTIDGMTNLDNLNIENNLLSGLPPQITSLSNLTTLWAGHNQLSGLPSEFGNLSKLEVILLNDNQLNSLPSSMVDLGNLIAVDLDNNQLCELPSTLMAWADSVTPNWQSTQTCGP